MKRTWSELTHPDDLQEDVLRFESVVRGEIDGYSLEKRFLRKDGTVVPVDLAVSCIRTPDGSVDYFVALLQDITERKKAERELQAHRDHLEVLVAERTAELAKHQQLLDETSRFARVGGWEYDVRKDELSWTAVVQEIHEVEPDYKLTVEAGLGFYAPEARPVVSQALESTVRTGQPFDLEVPLVTAKGRRLWVRAIGRAHVEDGEVVRVGGVLQDVDARRRTEEDLERHRAHLEELVAERTSELEIAEGALRESEERLRLIVSEAPFPIGLYAEDGEILLVNRAWCRITGYSRRGAPDDRRLGRACLRTTQGSRAGRHRIPIRPDASRSGRASSRSGRRTATSGSGISARRRWAGSPTADASSRRWRWT